jgi:hypothetical protein
MVMEGQSADAKRIMTVGELVAQLGKYPADSPVLFTIGDFGDHFISLVVSEVMSSTHNHDWPALQTDDSIAIVDGQPNVYDFLTTDLLAHDDDYAGARATIGDIRAAAERE